MGQIKENYRVNDANKNDITLKNVYCNNHREKSYFHDDLNHHHTTKDAKPDNNNMNNNNYESCNANSNRNYVNNLKDKDNNSTEEDTDNRWKMKKYSLL